MQIEILFLLGMIEQAHNLQHRALENKVHNQSTHNFVSKIFDSKIIGKVKSIAERANVDINFRNMTMH